MIRSSSSDGPRPRWKRATTAVVLLLAGGLLTIVPSTATAQEGPENGSATEVLRDDWAQVSAGGFHTCGIRTSGRLYCWGDDSQGQLGNGAANADRLAPAQVVGGGTSWTAVSAGFTHTCARRSSGRLFCWGDDATGQLGDDGGIGDRNVPVEVFGGATDWASVSTGVGHTCGRRTNGRLYCWGYDGDGQLGNGGSSTESPLPRQVAGNATNWASVSAGFSHTCAVRTNGRLFCWGRDDHGQVGDGGTGADRTVPARIGSATDWTAVTAGWDHTCGRRASGRLYCWGADDAGQVGNGGPDLSDQHRPVEVSGGATDWRAPTAGTGHTCARRTSGRLFCWGWDGNGQLGNGTPNNNESIPVEVLGSRTNWAAVDAGGDHTCARWRSGRVLCWGKDDQGQVGDGSPRADHPSPVAVH